MPEVEVWIERARKTFIKGLFKKKEGEKKEVFKKACRAFFAELAEIIQKDFMESKVFLGAGGKLEYVLMSNSFMFYCWSVEEQVVENLLKELAKKHKIDLKIKKLEVGLELTIEIFKRLMKEITHKKTLNGLANREFNDWICFRDALKCLERRVKEK